MNNDNNKQESKRVSAEEMARIIARNLNAQRDEPDDDFSAQEYETRAYHNAAVKAMERTKTQPAPQRSYDYDEEDYEEQKPRPSKKNKKKKSSSGKFICGFLCAILVIGIVGGSGVYLAGMNSRKGVFLDNTYINNINVGGNLK